jgi:hypothetical protein
MAGRGLGNCPGLESLPPGTLPLFEIPPAPSEELQKLIVIINKNIFKKIRKKVLGQNSFERLKSSKSPK